LCAQVKPARSHSILVVDDDVDTAESFAIVLQARGHAAEPMSDSRRVLEAVRRTKPHAVFLDIGMPHVDGFQLALVLKREFPDTFLVAITGHGSDDHRKRGRRSGFDAYVVKPIDPPMLDSILKTLFGPARL
jgi:two-component system CheB/CheR fusion protein